MDLIVMHITNAKVNRKKNVEMKMSFTAAYLQGSYTLSMSLNKALLLHAVIS